MGIGREERWLNKTKIHFINENLICIWTNREIEIGRDSVWKEKKIAVQMVLLPGEQKHIYINYKYIILLKYRLESKP